MTESQKTRTYQFAGVTRINFSALGQIRLIQGDEESVLVEGSDEALEHVKISQEGSTVQIRLYTWYDFLFIPRPANFTIRVKSLEAFSISGSAEMECDALDVGEKRFEISTAGSGKVIIGSLKGGDISASSSGSASYKIHSIKCQNFGVAISGSGNYQLAGEVKKADVHISGSGEIIAAELETRTAEIHISGTGKVTISAAEQLDIHISGSGEVMYSGEPSINQSISGSGKVRKQ